MIPALLCPNCGHTSPEIDDPETVKCPDCGWVTDYFEAFKQLENHRPNCYVDHKPATHYAPVKRRFFCATCASHQGLTDEHKIGVMS